MAQLRATLPERLTADRRGVLDLLDLILGAEIHGLEGTRARIPTLDYLITLLCTGGNPHAALQDPVTLTHRLHRLCERSDVDYDPRLPALEAEFYAAADLHEAELRNEVELRTLRRRKMELEKNFFAPARAAGDRHLQRSADAAHRRGGAELAGLGDPAGDRSARRGRLAVRAARTPEARRGAAASHRRRSSGSRPARSHRVVPRPHGSHRRRARGAALGVHRPAGKDWRVRRSSWVSCAARPSSSTRSSLRSASPRASFPARGARSSPICSSRR